MNEAGIRLRLLKWYDANRRVLPWRESPSPYRTWVSEIMLQQTQVAAVIPYFERFLKRFPDPAALARAPQEEVLKNWAGLGYYSRARNLRKAAAAVVSQLGGRIPADPEELKRLPGIGPYTAAAISSIAFGRPHELVDGNVERVLARLYDERGNAREAPAAKRLRGRAGALLHRKRPGDWNQALMELGALVCLPERPKCGACPLKRDCRARAAGDPESLPKLPAKKAPVRLAWTALNIRKGADLLLWRRSCAERFLPGHWGLPENRHLKNVRPGRTLKTVTHSITRHRIRLAVREAPPPRGTLPRAARWVPAARAGKYLVSSLWKKALKG